MWGKFILGHHRRRIHWSWGIIQCMSKSSASTLFYDRDTGIIYVKDERVPSALSKTPTRSIRPRYQTIIGIEIHAQLLVPTKLFSSAPTKHGRAYYYSQHPHQEHHQGPLGRDNIVHSNIAGTNDENNNATGKANNYVHAIDIAYPGSLPQPISMPTINASLLSAIVLNCNIIHEISRFERKHYFYRDLPQGYQITQQRWPIAQDGLVVFRPHLAGASNYDTIKGIGAWNDEKSDNHDDGATGAREVVSRRRGMRRRMEVQASDNRAHSTNDIVPAARQPVQLRIERIQIEQDTGRTIIGSSSSLLSNHAYVDHNRTGCALIEIVSYPDLRSAHEAAGAVSHIRKLLQMANVCDGKMEEGSLRCDLNISIAPYGDDKDVVALLHRENTNKNNKDDDRDSAWSGLPPNTGHRVEVKNLNSIRQIISATELEALRQAKLAQSGTPTGRETRTLIVGSGQVDDETVCIRAKGDAVDYRFMPEPDLPPLVLNTETLGCTLKEYLDRLRMDLSESPEDAASRLVKDYGLALDVAGVIAADARAILLFEETVKISKTEIHLLNKCDDGGKERNVGDDTLSTLVANFLCNDLFALMKTNAITNDAKSSSHTTPVSYSSIDSQRLGALVAMIAHGSITSSHAKKILTLMFLEGRQDHPRKIAIDNGWQVISDKKILIDLCNSIVFDPKHSSQLDQYKNGEERKKWKIEKYFSGKIMAASGGNAHPELMKEALSVVLENACRVS